MDVGAPSGAPGGVPDVALAHCCIRPAGRPQGGPSPSGEVRSVSAQHGAPWSPWPSSHMGLLGARVEVNPSMSASSHQFLSLGSQKPGHPDSPVCSVLHPGAAPPPAPPPGRASVLWLRAFAHATSFAGTVIPAPLVSLPLLLGSLPGFAGLHSPSKPFPLHLGIPAGPSASLGPGPVCPGLCLASVGPGVNIS